ncbi:DUF2987 domain-containing protein [Neiella sp. HB171785]|uniref:DUF2987 domain-containing protein n=1 Tax=Neiella litorisoli TaxID=2771431 RepID=A0A8J6QGP2_9GAMM|nr:DUF2987 domain-containing protein [Neiella litorisoli]MBD1389604.1 DUF2987 domain-containing protein [Neiella litorisoli]
MKIAIRRAIATCIALGLSAWTCHAEPLRLEYAGFYDYLKSANSTKYNRVKPAFFLNNPAQPDQSCVVNAEIHVGQTRYPLVANAATGEFFVPFDKRIKDGRGALVFQAPQTCKLQVAAVGRLYKRSFSGEELQQVAEQVYSLMENYAGSVRYFMPDWNGVVLQLSDGQRIEYPRERLPEHIELTADVEHVRLTMAAD